MFADSSFFPRGVGKAWWTMETKHSLIDWDPGRASDLKLDSARMTQLLAEKDEAMRAVEALAQTVRKGDAAVPPGLHELVSDRVDLFVTYVEGFVRAARVCLWARALDEAVPGADQALAAAIDELETYKQSIRALSDARSRTTPSIRTRWSS
jgi:hypothetical protein